jgi:hypothetical protein
VGAFELSVTPGQPSATLFWSAPEDAACVGVVLSVNPPDGSLAEPQTVTKGTSLFNATGLEFGREYAFTVKTVWKEDLLSAGLTKTSGIVKVTTSAGELIAELQEKAANTAANPYTIAPNFVTGTASYEKLLQTLEIAGRYVNLDLGASPMEAVIESIGRSEIGKKYVVSLKLPASVTRIGDFLNVVDTPGVFESWLTFDGPYTGLVIRGTHHGYYNLKSVDLPGVTDIGADAFEGCPSLESVSAPVVEFICLGAFGKCAALKEISLPSATVLGVLFDRSNGSVLLYGPVFALCHNLETVYAPKVTIVGGGCFGQCDALKTISLPEAVTIGVEAFGASGVENVYLPKAKTFDRGVFNYCLALKEIELPSAESVGMNIFAECYALKSVSLPSVTEFKTNEFDIGMFFRDTYQLESVSLGRNIPDTIGLDAFRDAGRDSGGFTIYVPDAATKATLEGYISNAESPWSGDYFGMATFSLGDGKFNGVQVR